MKQHPSSLWQEHAPSDPKIQKNLHTQSKVWDDHGIPKRQALPAPSFKHPHSIASCPTSKARGGFAPKNIPKPEELGVSLHFSQCLHSIGFLRDNIWPLTWTRHQELAHTWLLPLLPLVDINGLIALLRFPMVVMALAACGAHEISPCRCVPLLGCWQRGSRNKSLEVLELLVTVFSVKLGEPHQPPLQEPHVPPLCIMGVWDCVHLLLFGL